MSLIHCATNEIVAESAGNKELHPFAHVKLRSRRSTKPEEQQVRNPEHQQNGATSWSEAGDAPLAGDAGHLADAAEAGVVAALHKAVHLQPQMKCYNWLIQHLFLIEE